MESDKTTTTILCIFRGIQSIRTKGLAFRMNAEEMDKWQLNAIE